MKSSITDDMEHCYICGRQRDCWHHCLEGSGRRKQSEKYGLVIPLCNYHHNMSDNSVHFNKDLELMVKRDAQRAFERTHSRADWLRSFTRNYLED